MRMSILSHPAGRALLALPILAMLATASRADPLQLTPGAEKHLLAALPAAATRSPEHLQQMEAWRTGLEQDLGVVAGKLESLLATDDVHAAELTFDLERRAIALLQYAESGDLASQGLTHEQTTGGIRSMLQRILRYQERVKDHAQDKLDLVLPGEPGRKLSMMRGSDKFGPLFRQGTPKPGETPVSDAQRLTEMQQDFIAKGGNLKRDIKLLGIRYLKKLSSGQLAEWTQLDGDRISITSAGAKHPVIGGGKRVRGAGSMKLYRDGNGEVALVIVSNSSGNYKPGVGAVEGLVGKLVELGIPEERILTTSVVPEEPELVKLLLKARLSIAKVAPELQKEQIKQHVTKLMTETKPSMPLFARASVKFAKQARMGAMPRSSSARGRLAAVKTVGPPR